MSSCGQRRLRSDRAGAHADLCLRLAQCQKVRSLTLRLKYALLTFTTFLANFFSHFPTENRTLVSCRLHEMSSYVLFGDKEEKYIKMFTAIFFFFFFFFFCFVKVLSVKANISIMKTNLYNFDPLKPHFYTGKLRFTGLFIIFLISA